MAANFYNDEKAVARFWSKVQKGSADECWPWLGATSKAGRKGYGIFCSGPKQLRAHRASWEIDNKRSIPEGQCVLHACDNTICVNPDHLWIGSRADNIADMVRKGRTSRGERCRHSKLTTEAVTHILSSPDTAEKLSKVYGVTVPTINDIRSRKTWKHIIDPRTSEGCL